MIVACEKCQTRFQLDDKRVPQEGIRVRCSQCKHAFFIRSSDGDRAEVIDGLAGEAARTGGPSPPEAAQDLSAAPAEELGGQGEDESDWQFNRDAPQDLQEGEDDDSPLGESFDASEPLYETEPEEFDREALGHPDGWEPPPPPGSRETPEPAPKPTTVWDGTIPDPVAEPARATLETRSAPQPAGARAAPSLSAEPLLPAYSWGQRIGLGVGWLTVTVIFAAGVYGALVRTGRATDSSEAPPLVAGLRAEEVAGGWIENTHAGPIYVVTGRLRNAGGGLAARGEAIQVTLLSERGAVLDVEPAPAGLELSRRALHERAPASLTVTQAESARSLAWQPLAAGEGYRFHAVFGAIPSEAARFRLDAAPVPAPAVTQPDPADESIPDAAASEG